MKLLLFLKILMMPLINPRVLIYLIIALRILMTIITLLTISKGSLHRRKRLMLCRTLRKKKLLKLNASWMKKRRRVTNKGRKSGVATHLNLLMRVTLYLLLYMIALHAYQRRMNVILIAMILWILLKYPFLMKLILSAMMPSCMKFARILFLLLFMINLAICTNLMITLYYHLLGMCLMMMGHA